MVDHLLSRAGTGREHTCLRKKKDEHLTSATVSCLPEQRSHEETALRIRGPDGSAAVTGPKAKVKEDRDVYT